MDTILALPIFLLLLAHVSPLSQALLLRGPNATASRERVASLVKSTTVRNESTAADAQLGVGMMCLPYEQWWCGSPWAPTLPLPDYFACCSLCAMNVQCVSWTFLPNSTKGANGTCWHSPQDCLRRPRWGYICGFRYGNNNNNKLGVSTSSTAP
eukprot:RCo055172